MKIISLLLALAASSVTAGSPERIYDAAMENTELFSQSKIGLSLFSELKPAGPTLWASGDVMEAMPECVQKQKTKTKLMLHCKFDTLIAVIHAMPIRGRWIVYSTVAFEPKGIRLWNPKDVAYVQATGTVTEALCWAVPHLNKLVSKNDCVDLVKKAYGNYTSALPADVAYNDSFSDDTLGITRATVAVKTLGATEGFYVQVKFVDFK